MTFNMTSATDLPSLPSYELKPVPPLVPLIPDKYFTLVLPILAYWGLSMIFHLIDTKDWFPQYRLHTPAEVSNRNHVSRWEVVRDVIIQQVVQTIVGIVIAAYDPDPYTGMDQYNIALWAQRIRIAERAIPGLLQGLGLDAQGLSQKVFGHSPSLAGALAGGRYSSIVFGSSKSNTPAFAPWEHRMASFVYWYAVPALQFLLAIIIVDTWQYFLHRAMHMNRWLYTTFHSRHHRLYVPYAYGALYNHPFEGFLLDTCGAGLAYLVVGMTPRQSMWFFACSTLKTVDDHCGYAFPWDPLQRLTSNNAGYHDVHHQSWGIKTNFSQPFFTFWDRLLGTAWTGGDVSARYERTRLAAEKRAALNAPAAPVTGSKPSESKTTKTDAPYDSAGTESFKSSTVQPQAPAGKAAKQAANSRKQVVRESKPDHNGASVIAEETAEEQREQQEAAKCLPMAMQPGTLKGLRERVSGRHARKGSLLS